MEWISSFLSFALNRHSGQQSQQQSDDDDETVGEELQTIHLMPWLLWLKLELEQKQQQREKEKKKL